MPDGNASSLRTLVVGIDGACESVLETVSEAGATPGLDQILEAGATEPMASHVPPWTPSAWPTMYTGVNPGKHGVFGFLSFDDYDWEVVDHADVRAWSLWELLDRHDVRSVVVNVPVTYPARPFDGALVPGYVAPEDAGCHPEGLMDELREELGDYRIYGPEGDRSREQLLSDYRELTRMRGEAFRYLLDEYDPEFGFVQFQQTDTVCHELPDDEGALTEVYAAMDYELRAILRETDPDAVFVVSDHGIGPYDGVECRVNDLLADHGFVKTTRASGGMPSWSTLARGGDDDGGSALSMAVSLASRVGLTSQRIGKVLRRVGLEEFVLEHVPSDAVRAGTESVAFADSMAYMRDRVECGVRINLEGREPEGVVSPDEYEAVRDRLIAALGETKTPDGEPIFERVARREKVFTGPYVDEAPDVVVIPDEFEHYLSATLHGAAVGPLSEPWNHKFKGIFTATGPGVDEAAVLDAPTLLDVAPTVLSSLGVPPGEHMDGRCLPVVEEVGRTGYPDFEAQETGVTRDDGVEQRLANLGYIE